MYYAIRDRIQSELHAYAVELDTLRASVRSLSHDVDTLQSDVSYLILKGVENNEVTHRLPY